jgi:hypothetical protein
MFLHTGKKHLPMKPQDSILFKDEKSICSKKNHKQPSISDLSEESHIALLQFNGIERHNLLKVTAKLHRPV